MSLTKSGVCSACALPAKLVKMQAMRIERSGGAMESVCMMASRRGGVPGADFDLPAKHRTKT
jgi:hypothetical protein